MLDQNHTEKLTSELADRTLALILLETTTLILITIAALVGNFCVLLVFYKEPRLRSATSVYLISLATSDVLLSIFVMPTSIITSAYGRNIFSDKVGKLVGWVFAQSSFVSLYTTSLIAINRFFCVIKPMLYKKYFRQSTVTRTMIGVWIFLFLFLLVLYLSAAIKIKFYPGRVVYFIICTDATSSILTAISHFILVILPLTLTAICYWKLYALVKGQPAPPPTTMNPDSSENKFLPVKKEVQATRCLLSLVCGFVICWIPCSILFHVAIYINLSRSLQMVIVYTAYISSAINPFLYNILNKPFRKRFLKLICSRQNSIEVGAN